MSKQQQSMPEQILLSCRQLKKSYGDGHLQVNVLKGIDFSVHPGERLALVGPSGSGKSTFLHLLGGLDIPSSGEVLINPWVEVLKSRGTYSTKEKSSLLSDGKTKLCSWRNFSEQQRCRLRNQMLGFVYQFHHLLPEFTAVENVAMPLLLAGKTIKVATVAAKDMLSQVGLAARLMHKPTQMSGGERQRVAVARALVGQPCCVLADEPTGNLDQGTAAQIFDLLLTLHQQFNMALVMVTHDLRLASQLDKTYHLQEGLIT